MVVMVTFCGRFTSWLVGSPSTAELTRSPRRAGQQSISAVGPGAHERGHQLASWLTASQNLQNKAYKATNKCWFLKDSHEVLMMFIFVLSEQRYGNIWFWFLKRTNSVPLGQQQGDSSFGAAELWGFHHCSHCHLPWHSGRTNPFSGPPPGPQQYMDSRSHSFRRGSYWEVRGFAD